MGLRSVAETSLAAIVGGVEQAVPHFDGEGGLSVMHTASTNIG